MLVFPATYTDTNHKFTLTDTKATKDEAARTMRSSEDVNSNYSSSLDVPRSSPNSSNPHSPNRDPGQSELPQIPKLLDESGRDLLSDESEDKPFWKCSQVSERQAISELLEESFQWLNDRGDLAETSQLLNKRIALE